MRGPWARAVLLAVADEQRPEPGGVRDLVVELGRVSARVDACDVTLTVGRVPTRIWSAMAAYARGRGALEDAVEGRMQSSHLQHLLEEDWGEPLIPRPRAIGRTCTCDEGGDCEHVAALGLAFADAIDADPGAAAALARLRSRRGGAATRGPAASCPSPPRCARCRSARC